MSTDKFVQDLGLPVNADITHVEAAFMQSVKDRLYHMNQNYNEIEVHAEEKWLRQNYAQFFGYTMDWLKKEAAKNSGAQEYQGAERLKKDARAVIEELQKYITECASCYMHINRFMTLLREEIKAEEIKLSTMNHEKIRWTSDAGTVIAKYRKEKKILVARTERMAEARKILETVENDFLNIKKALINLFGKDKAEPLMRKINASLRVMKYDKVEKAIKKIKETKTRFGIDNATAKKNIDYIEHSCNKLCKLVEDNKDILMGEEDRIFLRPIETDMAYNGDIRDLQKIKGFLAKYHLPYMQYKLDTLSHLREKLLVINSLESLMTLYKRLIMGIVRPLKDIKIIRLYESDVLNHVKYLLTGHFTELPKILQRAEETVQEFRETRAEYEDLQKMKLAEIAVDTAQMVNSK